MLQLLGKTILILSDPYTLLCIISYVIQYCLRLSSVLAYLIHHLQCSHQFDSGPRSVQLSRIVLAHCSFQHRGPNLRIPRCGTDSPRLHMHTESPTGDKT